MTLGTEKIADQPYFKRRLIAVSSKAILEAVSKEQEKDDAAKGKETNEKSTLISNALSIAARTAGGLEFALAKLLVGIGVEAYNAVRKAQEKGAPIQLISIEDAQSFRFPPGHPREGVAYVCHPVEPNTYYTMADFHRVVFEHKFAEGRFPFDEFRCQNNEG